MADEQEEYELVELEYTEDDIAYYIEDEDGNELGFAITDEDGNDIEYYYDDNAGDYVDADDEPDSAEVDDPAADGAEVPGSKSAPPKPKHKVAPGAKAVKEESLAYMAGNAASKFKSKAKDVPDKIEQKAKEAKASKKTEKAKSDLKETADDLNEIYHAGKEVGDELKAAYDDIAGMFDFLPKKKTRRR